MLSKPLLDELKIIIREDYGKELTDQEVSQMANNLVNYFNLLSKIKHRAKEEVENRDLVQIKK